MLLKWFTKLIIVIGLLVATGPKDNQNPSALSLLIHNELFCGEMLQIYCC